MASKLDHERFGKVLALHDRTEHLGEKASAACTLWRLAQAAGLTVAEARALTSSNARQSHNPFDTAEMRAAWAERWHASSLMRTGLRDQDVMRRAGVSRSTVEAIKMAWA